MDLYPLPDNLRPVPPGPGSTSTRDYWTALAAEGQCELLHEPAEGATLGYAPPVYEQRAGRWVAVAYALGTPEERAAALVHQRRAAMSCTRAQGQLALLAAGLLDGVEAWLATQPRAVQIEYESRQIWSRNWPLVNDVRLAMGWTEEQLDALFDLTLEIPA